MNKVFAVVANNNEVKIFATRMMADRFSVAQGIYNYYGFAPRIHEVEIIENYDFPADLTLNEEEKVRLGYAD